MSEFAVRLQKLRKTQRRSRKVTSELCGLSPDAIRRYESGEAKPTVDSLIAIADYFDVSLDYLVGRNETK